MSPKVPACLFLYFVSIACAQSSITFIEYFLEIFKISSISQLSPAKCTTIIALVFLLILFKIFFGSIFKVSSSISASTGIAPTCKIEFIVEQNVKGVVITSSPFLIFKVKSDK